VRLCTHRGHDWTDRYPAIAAAAVKLRARSAPPPQWPGQRSSRGESVELESDARNEPSTGHVGRRELTSVVADEYSVGEEAVRPDCPQRPLGRDHHGIRIDLEGRDPERFKMCVRGLATGKATFGMASDHMAASARWRTYAKHSCCRPPNLVEGTFDKLSPDFLPRALGKKSRPGLMADLVPR